MTAAGPGSGGSDRGPGPAPDPASITRLDRPGLTSRRRLPARPGLPARPRRLAPTGGEEYAGLVSRLLALAVDAVLLAALVALIGAGAPAVWGAVIGSVPEWLRVCCGVLAAITPFGYFWLCWCTGGRTVGGMLLGTAVRRPDGSRVRAPRAAARAFLGLVFAPIALCGMLLTVVDPQRRALHDLLLRTVVRRI